MAADSEQQALLFLNYFGELCVHNVRAANGRKWMDEDKALLQAWRDDDDRRHYEWLHGQGMGEQATARVLESQLATFCARFTERETIVNCRIVEKRDHRVRLARLLEDRLKAWRAGRARKLKIDEGKRKPLDTDRNEERCATMRVKDLDQDEHTQVKDEHMASADPYLGVGEVGELSQDMDTQALASGLEIAFGQGVGSAEV